MIDGVTITPLKIVQVAGGDVFHALKNSDLGFKGFGEAYFSSIHYGVVKPWKRHRIMTLNLVVISGLIRFVVHDDRLDSPTNGTTKEYLVGLPNDYMRLTIAPCLWMAFQGVGKGASLLLNVADILHDPAEADRAEKEKFFLNWDLA